MLINPPVLTEALGDALYAFGPGVFNVRTYGAVADAVTNDRVAIQAAADAAYAYANTESRPAVVFFPPGTYIISGRINWNGTNQGLVTFRGAPAVIKMSGLGSGFVTATFANSSGNYGNITIEDLIFDNNNTKKNWAQCGIIFNFNRYPSQFSTLKNITVRRCEVRNAPRGSTVDPFVIPVSIDVYIADNTNRLTSVLIDNIVVEDCVFGKIGYGGSFGVQIQANFGSGALTGSDYSNAKTIRQKEWACNTYMDNIILRRLWHDGGPPSQTYYTNSNYIVGAVAHGGTLICEDLYSTNSGDDGLEVNSFYDVDIHRCQFSNAEVGAAILLNNGGGMPYPERQRIAVRNCRFGPTSGLNGGSSLVQRYNPAAPHGAIHISDLVLNDGTLSFRGAYQQLTIRNVEYTQSNGVTNGGFIDSHVLDIDALAGKCQIVIDGVTASYVYNYANPNNTNNSYLNLNVIRFNTLVDAVLDVRNVQMHSHITVTSGSIWGGGPTLGIVKFPISQGVNWGTDGVPEWFDSGSQSDIVLTSGVINPSNTAVLTDELRAVVAGAGPAYWTSATGPQTDINLEAEFTPGTTIDGFKGGVVGKSFSATKYTEAYVFDDGSNSFICLDKVVNGTRTSMLGAIVGGAGEISTIASPPSNVSDRGVQLASRISTATPFYVRYRQQGTAVSADYHSASMGWGATVTESATATFTTTSEIRNFVETSAYSGYVWVPISIDAGFDNYKYYRMSLFTGSFENLSFTYTDTLVPTAAALIRNATTRTLGRVSNAPIRMINSGINRHAGMNSLTDMDSMSDIGTGIRRMDRRNRNGSVASLTAPGSATSYTNASGYDEFVNWYGGTLTTPYVELSIDGGVTWEQIRGSSADGQAVLLPGDAIRWTYSSAPTFKRMAIS